MSRCSCSPAFRSCRSPRRSTPCAAPIACWVGLPIAGSSRLSMGRCRLRVVGCRFGGAFDSAERQDALILIAAFDAMRYATPAVLRLLRAGAKRSAIVGGVESGPWLMGMAGLLDGRRATTHWEDLEDFAARFPNVDVQPDRFVVDEPVFTTGGATPALDCLLSLIRARNGYSAALDVASLYIYEEVRTGSDAQPIVSLGRIRQHEPRVAEAIRIMEAHIDRPLTIAAIARRVGVSTRALETLFLKIVDASPGAYFRRAAPQRSETPRARHQSSDRRDRRPERLLRHRFPITRLQAAIRHATVRGAPLEALRAGCRLDTEPARRRAAPQPSCYEKMRVSAPRLQAAFRLEACCGCGRCAPRRRSSSCQSRAGRRAGSNRGNSLRPNAAPCP